MKRREFITLIGGAATWPLVARAQQPERMRRIGVLVPATADDAEYRARLDGFLQKLRELGWNDRRNMQLEYRWTLGIAEESRRQAAEMVALAPDVILVNGGQILDPLRQMTRALPIVFVGVVDPVGAGYVATLSRPGGNITGFTNFEYSLTAKWLELLKEIAPGVTRAAVLRDPSVASGSGQFGVIQAMATLLGVEVSPIDPHEATEIERAVTAFASQPNGCLIMTPTVFSTTHRELIISLAARHRLPAIYPFGYFVHHGGLISYGPDIIDQYRRAAGYVDRILKGEKPADLPVQAPTRYELIINLKTAKALSIDMPPTVLARADEVIE
jgi:putative ABC transport system substrate-binding protein